MEEVLKISWNALVRFLVLSLIISCFKDDSTVESLFSLSHVKLPELMTISSFITTTFVSV